MKLYQIIFLLILFGCDNNFQDDAMEINKLLIQHTSYAVYRRNVDIDANKYSDIQRDEVILFVENWLGKNRPTGDTTQMKEYLHLMCQCDTSNEIYDNYIPAQNQSLLLDMQKEYWIDSIYIFTPKSEDRYNAYEEIDSFRIGKSINMLISIYDIVFSQSKKEAVVFARYGTNQKLSTRPAMYYLIKREGKWAILQKQSTGVS